jgi:hypothetical protein
MRRIKQALFWLATVAMLLIPARTVVKGLDRDEPLLPYRYAWVGPNDVSVYEAAGDPAQMAPVRQLPTGTVWVSIKDEVRVGEQAWYRIGEREYVLSGDVWLGTPSTFGGTEIGRRRRAPLGFVLVDELNVRTRPDVESDARYRLSRYAVVRLRGVETPNGETWYRIGRDRYVKGEYVRVLSTIDRPDGVGPDEKWIAVNLAEQTLAAHEGDQLVFATLVSTGLPWWQTPEGLYRIWTKVRVGNMSGKNAEGDYVYYLQDVPWTMYFQGSYGLHAAYWHDGFGEPRSRGCVNLSPRDARWLFEWATPLLLDEQQNSLSTAENPGTWVYVHRTPAASMHIETWPELRLAAWNRVLGNSGGE